MDTLVRQLTNMRVGSLERARWAWKGVVSSPEETHVKIKKSKAKDIAGMF